MAESDLTARLRLFDEATERQREREGRDRLESTIDRAWTRDDLYDRLASRAEIKLRRS